jgi:hypothetical protein
MATTQGGSKGGTKVHPAGTASPNHTGAAASGGAVTAAAAASPAKRGLTFALEPTHGPGGSGGFSLPQPTHHSTVHRPGLVPFAF